MRVPAANPGGKGTASLASAYGVSESDLRSFTLQIENAQGELEQLVITRPRDWILHQIQPTENVEREIAEEDQSEEPAWVLDTLDVMSVTSSFQAEPVAATLGFLETTLAPVEALEAWRAVTSPSSRIATLAQKLQQDYLEQTLADVEQNIATADWLQAIDGNELNGMNVYLQLPELEIDSWATLAGVGPARS